MRPSVNSVQSAAHSDFLEPWNGMNEIRRSERRFFLREFCKARSGSACGTRTREIGITKIESRSHNTPSVESHLPAAGAWNLGNVAMNMEWAEDTAHFGALCFGGFGIGSSK